MTQDFNLTLKNLSEEFRLIDHSKSSKKPKKIKKKSSPSSSSSSIDYVEQRTRIHSCTFPEHLNIRSPSLTKSQSYPKCLCEETDNDLRLNPCMRCSSTRTDLGYSSGIEILNRFSFLSRKTKSFTRLEQDGEDYSSCDFNWTKSVELTDRTRKVKLKVTNSKLFPFDLKVRILD